MSTTAQFTTITATIVIDTDHSTAIRRLEWSGDYSNGDLTVTYRNGGTYRYEWKVGLAKLMPVIVAHDEGGSIGSALYRVVEGLTGERVPTPSVHRHS